MTSTVADVLLVLVAGFTSPQPNWAVLPARCGARVSPKIRGRNGEWRAGRHLSIVKHADPRLTHARWMARPEPGWLEI